jgi:hypothetical protein
MFFEIELKLEQELALRNYAIEASELSSENLRDLLISITRIAMLRQNVIEQLVREFAQKGSIEVMSISDRDNLTGS